VQEPGPNNVDNWRKKYPINQLVLDRGGGLLPGAARAAHSGLPLIQVTSVPNRGIVETAILALASWT
jgi:hypothetical protein